jgi:hypothetical protein
MESQVLLGNGMRPGARGLRKCFVLKMHIDQDDFSMIDSGFDSAMSLNGLFEGEGAVDRHLKFTGLSETNKFSNCHDVVGRWCAQCSAVGLDNLVVELVVS